jgi:hypothetical protein
MTPMPDTFEDRLLDALLDRYDNLASRPAATEPMQRCAVARRYAVPLGGLAIGATVAAVAFAELGGPTAGDHAGRAQTVQPAAPAYALAAWTAQPTPASSSQVSAAESRCSQPAPVDKQGPTLAGGPWSAVVVDTRGDLTLALYSGAGSATMACLASPSFVWLDPIGTGGAQPVTDDSASLDEVTFRGAVGNAYAIAIGRAGSAVTGVGLQRVDGSVVTA